MSFSGLYQYQSAMHVSEVPNAKCRNMRSTVGFCSSTSGLMRKVCLVDWYVGIFKAEFA